MTACLHIPTCPAAGAADHDAARIVSAHPEQGWNQLCNGVVVFDDTGELSPAGVPTAPHRPAAPHCGCADHRLCVEHTAEIRAHLASPTVVAL